MRKAAHQEILFNNELKILEGKNKRNIWILAIIISISFIGLGHSLGGLKHLKKRMDNPFTKWVNLPINVKEYAQSQLLQESFEEKSIKDSFFLENIKGYKREFFTLASKDGKKTFQCIARTIDPQEQLLQEILKPSNVVFSNLASPEDLPVEKACWVIVKKEMLGKLGFTNFDKTINKIEFRNKYGSIGNLDIEFSHYLPLIAIVHDLPDLAEMIVPEHFNELFFLEKTENQFINTSITNKIEFLAKKEWKGSELENYFKTDSFYLEDVSTESYELYSENYYLHEVYLSKALTLEEKLFILSKLKLPEIRPYTTYNCDVSEELSLLNPYYLAFNFNDLSRVRAFREKVKRDFQFEISLNQVEDKENFSMVARLTTILSLLLFALSISSVLLFLGNLLLSHIDKISPNLGTFKAFGLSDQNLISDYHAIILQFLFRAMIRSLAIILCYSVLMYSIDGHFYLLDWKVIAALAGIVISVRIIVNSVVVNKLKKSPGNLIYNR